MVASTSRISYSDCFELMDQALADSKGTRIKFGQSGDAWHFRLRLHAARRIDRVENADTYDSDHPMHGRSVYDEIIVRLKQLNGDTWLYLEKVTATEFEVESLSEGEPNGIDEPNGSNNGTAPRESGTETVEAADNKAVVDSPIHRRR